MRSTPEPTSLALSETSTELVYQVAAHGPPAHEAVVTGAVASATTSNEAAAEGRPAPFVALTCWPALGSAGVSEYESVRLAPVPETVHPDGPGNEYEAIADCGSVAL